MLDTMRFSSSDNTFLIIYTHVAAYSIYNNSKNLPFVCYAILLICSFGLRQWYNTIHSEQWRYHFDIINLILRGLKKKNIIQKHKMNKYSALVNLKKNFAYLFVVVQTVDSNI